MKIETRIWELLWLLTGVLVPGKVLFYHVTLFLRSSSNPTALECYNRIQKIQKYFIFRFNISEILFCF